MAIKVKWDEVTNMLRGRVGKDFDGRNPGPSAFLLVDGRKKNSLTRDQAALISTMHSQFKSYTRRQATVDQFMTYPDYKSFIDAAETVKNFLKIE